MRKLFVPTLIVLMAVACELHAAGTDKTLVSWATVVDKSVKAGSILTVQNGRAFDGIFLAELADGKWMAGSDSVSSISRTNKQQGDWAAEKADTKTLIQMAIVYKDDQISIYRNGVPYASYKTKNIDLLSSKSNIVVFGLRQVGGGTWPIGGSFGGAIEDARIYAQALAVEEIKK